MNLIWQWFAPRLRLLFLLRYSLLTGLFPPTFVLLALYVNRQLFRGLLVLETPGQLFNVTWLSLLVATLVMVTLRVVQINAPDRFHDYAKAGGVAPTPGPWRLRWLLLAAIALPIPLACIGLIQDDPPPPWNEWSSTLFGVPIWLLATFIVLLGLLAGFVVLLLFTAAQLLLLHPSVVSQNLLPFELWGPLQSLKKHEIRWLYGLGDRLARLANHFGPGYARTLLDPQTDQPVPNPATGQPYLVLAPGHAQVALWFGCTLLAYVVSWVWSYFGGWIFAERSVVAALFYLLLSVLLVGSALGALEFLLDYYRVPVLLTLALVAVLGSTLSGTDHFYDLNPDGKALAATPDLDFQSAIARHEFPAVQPELEGEGSDQGPKRTLVVVTAAGGGIQAAAWTTQVLAGLDELYGPDFSRSIGLISSVSGGSVGTMYYIDNGNWAKGRPPFTKDARDHMVERSRRSGLEATGWGLAYPDLMRTFVPFLVPRRLDRGWALEESWRHQLTDEDLRLGAWIEPTRQGAMPAVVFNATLAETGKRLWISPVHGPRASVDEPNEPVDFFEFYKQDKANPDPRDNPNPRVATAVRLSATFPYVSPICRPYREGAADLKHDYHVADGGYSENEGGLTVLEWVYRLLRYYRHPPAGAGPRPFDRVLVIRIQPFPPKKEDVEADTKHGWLYEALGPITTIQNVRVASQAERNSFDFRLLVEEVEAVSPAGDKTAKESRDQARARAARDKTTAATHSRALGADPALVRSAHQQQTLAEEESRKVLGEITWTTFAFSTGDQGVSVSASEEEEVPLSWKLTQKQQKAIENAWQRIKDKKPVVIANTLNEPPLVTVNRFFRPVKQPAP
jgi:hypothetical protein